MKLKIIKNILWENIFMSNIPLMDLTAAFPEIYNEIEVKILDLIKNTQFIKGKELELFENEFSSFSGSDYAIGCANGTDALVVALKVLGIGHGDTVLVPANTFIATSEAVTQAGATVNFIDVDPVSKNIDPQCLKRYLEKNSEIKRIKAVIAVHLYGTMADVKNISEICNTYGLKLIEDAAQAHGAEYEGKKVGTYGDFATYSFYPGKNLGAFGDAGALTCNDEKYYEFAKAYIDHGRIGKKYEHSIEGANMRMDTLQAAVLRIKLKYLANSTNMRIEKVKYYQKKLSGIKNIKCPEFADGMKQVWHLYVIESNDRDALQEFLKARGISSGIHYPIPLHLQKAYNYLQYREGDFPIAEKLSDRILSLPLWPEISHNQIDQVCSAIKDFFS